MRCPDCGEKLKEVLALTKHGVKIKVDQCFSCGGIWFDNLELPPIPKKEIEKIEKIDIDKLQEKSFIGNGNSLCPKCSTKLETFKDYNFPEELEVEYCKKCDGLWMNRGEATDFKIWQEEKKAKNKKVSTKEDEKFQESIKNLLASHKSDNFGAIGGIGKALSMHINPRTLRPLDSGGNYAGRKTTEADRTMSVIMSVLQVLLRLFLRY